MPSSLRWPDAALAGLACSMRTFAGPSMLAVRGRIAGRPRVGVLVAATGELAADKSAAATDRTDPPALVGRIAAGAYTGREIAGGAGACAGAITAGLATFSGWRIRGLVVEATGLPDPVVAVGEDIIALAVAAIATRPDDPSQPSAATVPPVPDHAMDGEVSTNERDRLIDPESRPVSLLRDGGFGLIAGIAGTAAMTIAQGAEFVLTDAEPSSSPADVADLLKRRAGRGRLKRRHRRVANQAMHWLFGASWGVPYGIVTGSMDVAPEVSGPVFGLLVWGAALGHQPALGIAEVPWKRSLGSLGSEAAFHLVYGIGAGAALRALRG